MTGDGDGTGRQAPAPGTPILERVVGALGVGLLLGVAALLGWDALRGGTTQPTFRFEVIGVEAAGDRHTVRFRVRNEGGGAVENLAVEARLAAEPPESRGLTLDFLAAGEEREAALVFAADPSRYPLVLAATNFTKP